MPTFVIKKNQEIWNCIVTNKLGEQTLNSIYNDWKDAIKVVNVADGDKQCG